MNKCFPAQAICLSTLFLIGCSDSSNNKVAAQCGLDNSQIGTFVTIPSGSFIKSEKTIYPEEGQPEHKKVEGFEMQSHEVTNSQFAKFVTETGYITDAEKSIKKNIVGQGSAVFSTTSDGAGEWSLISSATWRHPYGQGSTIKGMDNHPAIHVSYNDAAHYAQWAGGRLPTHIEWEYASTLGRTDTTRLYSGAFDEQGKPIANTWQGLFPIINKAEDGFQNSSPVGCFSASGIGLFDMIGNVWEWTSTVNSDVSNIIKGGSFLCAPNYCRRYRSAAKQTQERDFSTNHLGFRIVRVKTNK